MKEDIERIKGVDLDHIDHTIGKTNNTLLVLQSLLGKKFQQIQNLQPKIPISQPKTQQKQIHHKLKKIATLSHHLKTNLLSSGITEECSRMRKDVQLMVRQIIKYYTSQLSAKDNIIAKLEKNLAQESFKLNKLQQQLLDKDTSQQKLSQTMTNKPIPSNSQNKYSSLCTTRKCTILQDIINTEVFKSTQQNDGFIQAKSQILQKVDKKRVDLINISQELKWGQNQLLKVTTNRQRREDSTPSLPKPLRKTSVDNVQLLLNQPRRCTKVQNGHKLITKCRRQSFSELQTNVESNRSKMSTGESFKGKRALLITSEVSNNAGLSKVLKKNY